MELRDKKEAIYRFVRLSMPLYAAQICAECTPEEIELLNKDEDFIKRINWNKQNEVRRLLERMDTILDKNSSKGISKELIWKLGKLDPKTYGDNSKVTLSNEEGEKKFNLVFEISNNTDDSNVEISN
jgi:tRNA U34 5-carboxymethylaminomethyl modifying enzyme MnmG/GidA